MRADTGMAAASPTACARAGMHAAAGPDQVGPLVRVSSPGPLPASSRTDLEHRLFRSAVEDCCWFSWKNYPLLVLGILNSWNDR
jgi:hypothetical protein